ncbi:hypothetical protein BDB01DRAFT_83573 [Pilobolus umbonatus]|nr:hypothetical protein BDB01DRAFT_83573 [Pilobolus umbonatus]
MYCRTHTCTETTKDICYRTNDCSRQVKGTRIEALSLVYSSYFYFISLSMDLRYLAKLDSICRAYITNRKIESQLQSYKGYLTYHMRPLLKSLSTMETHVISHPAADKMEVICVSQKDLLKTCAYNQSKNTAKTPIETIPWIEGQLKNMKNDILIRSCGWWESGHRECYAVIQDKLDWKNIPLQNHISLDKATSIISFTYTNLDTCISQFLSDWESIFMMVNIARQVPSIWLKKYRDQLQFRPTNLKQLTFSYAKHFTCTIKWVIRDKGRPNQYDIELAMLDDNSKAKSTSLPLNNMRNPHWRISTFLKDALNEKRDLIDFIQILFQTLPLMACLERLEMESVQQGDVGKITIIPRSYDSVRVIFSATHAIDIRFTDPSTLCVSDAAYHHIFYSSHAKSKPDTFVAPRPYIVSPSPSPHENTTMKPIRVAQQFKFAPFLQFTGLLATLENWIFPEEGDLDEYSIESNEPTAVPFQHGLLCSASLCQGLLDKLQALV